MRGGAIQVDKHRGEEQDAVEVAAEAEVAAAEVCLEEPGGEVVADGDDKEVRVDNWGVNIGG